MFDTPSYASPEQNTNGLHIDVRIAERASKRNLKLSAHQLQIFLLKDR